MNKALNIVWLKRDLRTFDHEALFHAEHLVIDYIIIYLFEPNQINHSDYSERHQQFIYHSILAMNDKLKEYNRQVHIFYADAELVFNYLTSNYKIKTVLSYQESGTLNSWKRDKKIKSLLKTNNVEWLEFENQAVIRGSKNRLGWDKHWYSYANSPIIKNTFSNTKFEINNFKYELNIDNFPHLKKYPTQFQPAGEKYATRYLKSFLKNRYKAYNFNISKPEKSRVSCSRLSTYLAWGNISVRYVYQNVVNAPNFKINKRAYTSFLARLKWRSHFIQKFETDCSYEQFCINKGYEQMNYSNNNVLLEKWKNGQTGFPMVDASMRCLIDNGWLNLE